MGFLGKKPQTLLIPIYSTTVLYDNVSFSCVFTQLGVSNGEFNVLINGNNVSSLLSMTGSNISDSTYFLERSASNSMLVQFPSGLGLLSNYSNGLLNFVLTLPPTFTSATQGLLGTLNDNISDDLIFRNGTLLSTESTDADKHTFGQSCTYENNRICKR